jgi:flagellar hook protein FlgE
MAFFGVPLSGLIASQDQLSSVSNNLANLDTVGFKDQTVSFSDLFAQSSLTNGANNPIESGLGVTTSQTNSDFTDGGISSTGIASNMALSGNGFFVTQSNAGTQNYTRAGDFTVNPAGYLTTASGDLVMGYGATNGVVSTTGSLQSLQVGLGSVIPASATSQFNIKANLNSNATTGSTYSSTTPVFDSLGAQHVLTVTYTKSATTNQWTYQTTMPTADLSASALPTSGTNTILGSGTLNFDSSGNMVFAPTVPATVPATYVKSLSVAVPGFADGGAASTLAWDLADANGNGTITQTDLGNTTASTQNGQGAGTLTSFSVQADGTIQGVYSNGQTDALGQVAIASFANTQGLTRVGGNDYQATPGSGTASIGTAKTGGRGTITGGSVEASNVDVAAEFSKMIVAQQAYSANAKTITTFQQISQATIAMIQ